MRSSGRQVRSPLNCSHSLSIDQADASSLAPVHILAPNYLAFIDDMREIHPIRAVAHRWTQKARWCGFRQSLARESR